MSTDQPLLRRCVSAQLAFGGCGAARRPAMAAVANTALVAASANRGSRPATASANRASVGTGFAGARNAWAAGRPPPPPRRGVTVRTQAGATGARPSSSSPPDAVTYSASISTDTPLHEPPRGEQAKPPAYPPLAICLPWMWIIGGEELKLLLIVWRVRAGLLRRVPPGPRARVPRQVPRREQERAARRCV